MYCTLSEKWRAQATISTVFVRTAPVLSCLWGLQILAVSIFGQSCHHALHQTIPKLPINSYYTKLWQDTLYILKSRSKPLSWMFLIGTHQPKHTHTQIITKIYQILIRLTLENSGLNSTDWFVGSILNLFEPSIRAMPKRW